MNRTKVVYENIIKDIETVQVDSDFDRYIKILLLYFSLIIIIL